MRPRLSSNSGIFAKRGDPWVSRKEGERDFNRNLETEDPEYDFDHRFHEAGNVIGKPVVAQARPEYRDPPPDSAGQAERDAARRKTSILRRMNSAINQSQQTTSVGETFRSFRPCPGCRLARCISKSVCQKPRL